MKTLFSENGNKYRYNQDAINLSDEATEALRPIFEKYIALGYSPREISHAIHLATIDLELMEIL